MRSWVLAASLLAAAATPALAADLDDGTYRPRHGAYNHHYPHHAPPPSYDDNDDDGDDAREKHAGTHRPYGGTCARSEDIRYRLTDLGWRDFHAPHPGAAEVVTLRARRPNGQLFELTLERCSGRLVYARPLEHRPLRSFAPGEFGPGRWDRYESDDPWFRRPYAYHRPRHWDRED